METGQCGGEPFALQVKGNSMEPEFVEGHIIVIDPSAVLYDGCYVMALLKDEFVLRQLNKREQGYSLSVLTGSEPETLVSSLDAVQGMVIQRSARRRDVKYYPDKY